ncbi:hypothetical protein [Chryseobacterium sp. Leaf405]|uniref:hypothetical protein n=1 Tax=Chryseobacterium sp. Leaf405 TaxID=1736367 RepID=UPI0010388FE6|nr:hypothetical protein [Chryseobacterium sp. Leaf405]
MQPHPQIGFFSVTDLNADWGERNLNDVMTQANLTLDLVKGLRLNEGFHYTPVTGILPSAGMIYTFVNDQWLVIASPRIDLQQNPNRTVGIGASAYCFRKQRT